MHLAEQVLHVAWRPASHARNARSAALGRPRAYPIATLTEIITMQYIRATLTGALFLAFGTIVPAYAQRGNAKEEQSKVPEKQQSRPQQAAPRAAQPQRPEAQAPQPQARATQQQRQPQ